MVEQRIAQHLSHKVSREPVKNEPGHQVSPLKRKGEGQEWDFSPTGHPVRDLGFVPSLLYREAAPEAEPKGATPQIHNPEPEVKDAAGQELRANSHAATLAPGAFLFPPDTKTLSRE